MLNAFKNAFAGCKDLPHVGPHPGRLTMVFMGLLMGVGGAQNGWGGLLAAMVLYVLFLGPMYLIGGHARYEHNKRLEAQERVPSA